MQATELLLEQVKWVHWWIETSIMNTVTPEQAHWYPPGTLVNSLGGNYAHLLVNEDLIINAILKGGVPLYASSWAGKTGMSTLPPLPTPENPGLPDWREWSTQVDLTLLGLGTQEIQWILSIIVGHIFDHGGEIACLKGLQGSKGYRN